MIDTLIFIIFVVMVFLIRKLAEEDKECRSKKSTNKQTMNEKAKKSYHITPHTERNASGCNWEAFKSILSNSSLEEIAGKENFKQKSVMVHQKKRSHVASTHGHHVTRTVSNDEEIYDDSKKKLTKQVGMDCEMVGIGDGSESMLARVSIVNKHGYCVYDKYVKAREPVQDYRTKVSGIRPHHLESGEEFDIVQKEVADILRGRVLVGHALKHDLDVLYLSHPRKNLRDTSRFKTFRQLFRGNTPSLKKLSHQLLGREIQIGEHNSVEDARAAMQLYVLYKNKWESEFYSKR